MFYLLLNMVLPKLNQLAGWYPRVHPGASSICFGAISLDVFASCLNLISQCARALLLSSLGNDRDLTRLPDIFSNFWFLKWLLAPFCAASTHHWELDSTTKQWWEGGETWGPVVLHWVVVNNGIWASCTVCLPVTMEAGQLMSKSLPPKINLHEGREKQRERERGGRRRKGKRLSAGTEGQSLRFNGIKTAQFL